MEHRDIKRFITGFLVLATITGSLTLVFSSFRDSTPTPVASVSDSADGTAPKIGDKAVTEAIPASSDTQTYDLSQPYTPTTQPGDNFTDNLINGIAYNIVKANPDGPTGTSSLSIPPDLNTLVQGYVNNVAFTPLLYPIDSSRIQIKQKYTTTDISNYLVGVGKIWNNATGPTGLTRLIQNATDTVPDTDALTASGFIFAKAQEDMYALTVPAPFADLNSSLLESLELRKQIANVDYTNDPVKTIAYLSKFPMLSAQEDQKVGIQLGRVQQNLPQWISEASNHPSISDRIALLVTIQHANAQAHGSPGTAGGSTGHGLPTPAGGPGIAVSDISVLITSILNGIGIYGNWGQVTTTWLRTLATQTLKNQLVHRLVQQTIRWVQGGGKPQFVTNWKQFLGDTANNAAGAAIQQIEPRLCTGLRPFVVTFLTRSVAQGYDQVNCTLSQVVRNIQSFYNDFNNGGWVAFGQLTQQPQNNLWGAIAISAEQSAQGTLAAQTAAQQEAETGKGFLPTKSCVNYSIATVDQDKVQQQAGFVGIVRCYQQGQTPDYSSCTGTDPNAPCTPTYTPHNVCDVKICKPGGEQITTPGDAVAEQTNIAIGAGLNQIINAQDLTNLVSVMVNSGINRLVQLGEKGLLGLFTSSDNPSEPSAATGPGTGTGTGTGTTPLPDDPADVATQRQTVLQLVALDEQRLGQASSSLGAWPAQVGTTVPLLTQVASACSSRTTEAQARITTINGMQPHIDDNSATLTNLSTTLAQIKAAINNATTFLQLSSAADSLSTLNNDIGDIATRITLRSSQLTQVSFDAQANLANNACSTPLSQIDDQ